MSGCNVCREDPERRADIEIAHAQAVEFAQYAVDHAKGKMAERAEHFLSFKYSQEVARRLSQQGAPSPIAVVEKTQTGPRLIVHGIRVNWWLGCENDAHVDELAARINLAAREVAK